MSIEKSLIAIRVGIRKNGTSILRHLIENYLLYRIDRNHLNIVDKCSFCGDINNISKEHVLPQWLFDDIQGKFFLNGANGLKRGYAKTTIPACRICNNDLLNEIERHIKSIFVNKSIGTNSYSLEDYENIIRWLEIIHYKWEVNDMMQRFITYKGNPPIDYIHNFPLAMMRQGGIGSYEVKLGMTRSLRRLSIRDKRNRVHSILFAKTKNKSFHFFHNSEFIFIELPQFNMAVFYFFNRSFKTSKAAKKAMEVELKKNY